MASLRRLGARRGTHALHHGPRPSHVPHPARASPRSRFQALAALRLMAASKARKTLDEQLAAHGKIAAEGASFKLDAFF